uniref:Uncharacterized protein n=1 Tax=viral metagenome TaxID=1070528 RepID=A0A6C0BC38_9ZZZZ
MRLKIQCSFEDDIINELYDSNDFYVHSIQYDGFNMYIFILEENIQYFELQSKLKDYVLDFINARILLLNYKITMKNFIMAPILQQRFLVSVEFYIKGNPNVNKNTINLFATECVSDLPRYELLIINMFCYNYFTVSDLEFTNCKAVFTITSDWNNLGIMNSIDISKNIQCTSFEDGIYRTGNFIFEEVEKGDILICHDLDCRNLDGITIQEI